MLPILADTLDLMEQDSNICMHYCRACTHGREYEEYRVGMPTHNASQSPVRDTTSIRNVQVG